MGEHHTFIHLYFPGGTLFGIFYEVHWDAMPFAPWPVSYRDRSHLNLGPLATSPNWNHSISENRSRNFGRKDCEPMIGFQSWDHDISGPQKKQAWKTTNRFWHLTGLGATPRAISSYAMHIASFLGCHGPVWTRIPGISRLVAPMTKIITCYTGWYRVTIVTIWLIYGYYMVTIWLMIVNNNLVGGIATPLKNDGVSNSWDDDIPNIWKVIKMFQTTNQ